MDTIITEAGKDPVTLSRPIPPNNPGVDSPVQVHLTPTTRVDAGVEGEQVLERTIGVIVKAYEA